jgi:NAD(P)-dependent dehydrogenase (short-subunit alcohol dehydrogenase family)
MDRLKGKKALVIGASTGIGREVCRVFAQEGADVAVGDFGHEADKASLLQELHGFGREAFAIEVDVRDEAQVKAAVDQTIERLGQLDIIVNNAGVSPYRGPSHLEPTESWDYVMDVNLRGVYFGMKYALPHMIERGYGRIINTASQLAHKPSPFNTSYVASKAGVIGLTASVAHEVALQGITVNAVCPGPTVTPMFLESGKEDGHKWKIDQVPMKRAAEPIEIAWAYVYLASDEGSYCTGQSISPNGGDVMW